MKIYIICAVRNASSGRIDEIRRHSEHQHIRRVIGLA